MDRHHRILLGVALGALLGLGANLLFGQSPELAWAVSHVARPVGQIFLRALFMLIVPLLFSALVLGVADLPMGQLGRMGKRMLGYTVVVSSVAVAIGLVLVNVIGPGRGMPRELLEQVKQSPSAAMQPPLDVISFIVSLVPDNPVKAAATGDMLGLIFFSLVFGLALAQVRTPAGRHLRETIQGLYDVMMRLIDGVLALAPIGVGALLFALTAQMGLGILKQLAAYVGVVLLGLGLQMGVVYSLSVRFFGGMSPWAFFRGSRLAMLTAFSTASSSATLPTAIQVAEGPLALPRHVSRFVLTAGSAMNQNGTALFEGVTVLFLAQVFGVELGIREQALVIGICILAGIGTAGIPAGSLPVIAMILGMLGIPPEGLGLVLGVDRLLDMARTAVNVTGDLAAAVYVARGEPQGTAGAAAVEMEQTPAA